MSTEATLRTIAARFPRRERTRLRAVYEHGVRHLSIIKRRTGEHYSQHGFEVALTLNEASPPLSLLCAALLHDILVHPNGESLLSASPLTNEERKLVEQMHMLRRLHIDENTADLDQVIVAFTTHEHLLPLRMAHRLNDVRHLSRFQSTLQRQIANETLHMYTAIAGRLGMIRWREDMENICFESLQPLTAKRLQKRFQQRLPLDKICLRQGVKHLQKELRKNNISAQLEGRIKSLYSTYRKMVLKRRPFEELTDRLAIRVIVPTVMDCYRALAIIHAVLHPIPGKLKDYIGAPKENGYRSIHTVVYPSPGITEMPIEIQIRTEAMHRDCLFGNIAHDEYKGALYALTAKPARVNLVRNLESLREDAHSPKQFEEVLRKYFSDRHIVLFDDRNNIYHLKAPATALDFAYHAFPQRWKKMKKVIINGRVQPLSTRLRDGDTVEARFGIRSAMNDEWMKACLHRDTKKALKEGLK